MGSKNPSIWEKFERISKIIQLLALIAGTVAIAAIPFQIQQIRHEINQSTFDVLWQLDTKLREAKNSKIASAIWYKRPVITKRITEEDLDSYLTDLSTIDDVYERGLISIEDVDGWFADQVIYTLENAEVKKYIVNIRKINPDYYVSLEELYKKLKEYEKKAH
jgi:hypothetical protein